jgi:hypothetical protein
MDAFASAPALASTERLAVAEATRPLLDALQACLDGCPDYFARVEGARAAEDAAARLLDEAEADPLRRLYLFSLKRGGVPAALLDLWLDQPEPGTAHLGLLVVREALQGRGLGREAMAALEAGLVAGRLPGAAHLGDRREPRGRGLLGAARLRHGGPPRRRRHRVREAAARLKARERRYSALVAGVKTRAQRTTVPRSPS